MSYSLDPYSREHDPWDWRIPVTLCECQSCREARKEEEEEEK